jgi:hypothetical protein
MFTIGESVKLKDPNNAAPPLPLAGVTYHVKEAWTYFGLDQVRLAEDPDEIAFAADLFEAAALGTEEKET